MRNAEYESEELDGLSSAEDFLDHFDIDYDQKVVHVNRLHILQRFHDDIEKDPETPQGEDECNAYYKKWLTKAYEDFVSSDAITEKVFKVLQEAKPTEPPKPAFVSVEQLLK